MQIWRWYKRSKSFDQNDLRRWSLGFISGKEDRSPKYIFSVPKSILKNLRNWPISLNKTSAMIGNNNWSTVCYRKLPKKTISDWNRQWSHELGTQSFLPFSYVSMKTNHESNLQGIFLFINLFAFLNFLSIDFLLKLFLLFLLSLSFLLYVIPPWVFFTFFNLYKL